jgi:hypothetical protein
MVKSERHPESQHRRCAKSDKSATEGVEALGFAQFAV